jgi:hypothetical protein
VLAASIIRAMMMVLLMEAANTSETSESFYQTKPAIQPIRQPYLSLNLSQSGSVFSVMDTILPFISF